MKRKNIKVVVGLGLAQLAFFNAPVFAQTQKPSSLNEVVVTATRSPQKQADIGKVVRVINADEISRSQGRTLPELLNTVAGLTIGGNGSNPGEIKSVFLRGASAGNTLILIDGIAVNDASSPSGEYNIAGIAIEQIERIEILKGGNSVLYGSDAVAGVINIITKKGTGKLHGNVLQTAGSYNTFKQAVGLSGSLGKTDISLNASNLDSKSFSSAQAAQSNNAKFEKDNFNQKAIGFNINQQITQKWALLTSVNYNNNTANFDGGAFADAKEYVYYKNALLINVGSKINLNNGIIRINVSQNNVQNKFDYQGAITNNKGKITNAEGVYTAQINGFVGITSGLNYKFSKTDQKDDYGILSSDSAKNNIASMFTSLFFKGGKYFRLELGGRFNKHNQYGNNVNYTFNPSFIITERAKVFFNASSAYKVPTLFQLTSQYRNPDGLKPEASTTIETGFDINFIDNKLTLNASFYKRKITDAIDFDVQKSGGYGYVNQNKENTKGLELELGTNIIKNLNFSAFYAYTNGTLKLATKEISALSRRPKNTFGASAGYNFGKKVYMSLLYKYTGQRADKYYDVNTAQTVDVDLKQFNKVDAYLQYTPFSKLTLFADIKNIFDAQYNDFAGYTTMGTNFNAGLIFNLN